MISIHQTSRLFSNLSIKMSFIASNSTFAAAADTIDRSSSTSKFNRIDLDFSRITNVTRQGGLPYPRPNPNMDSVPESDQEQSITVFQPEYGGSICICRLPYEIDCESAVRWLVETRLFMGSVDSVNLFKQIGPDGVEYQGAYVDFSHWYAISTMYELDAIFKDIVGDRQASIHILNVFRKYNRASPSPSSPSDHIYHLAKDGYQMTYLRVRPVPRGSGGSVLTVSELPRLQLAQDDWTGFYIPHIPENLYLNQFPVIDQDTFVAIFEKNLRWGKIKRVDFIKGPVCPAKPSSNKIQSAYVHLEYWCDTAETRSLRYTLETYGSWKLHGFSNAETDEVMRFAIQNTTTGEMTPRFLNLKINQTPIPDADSSLNVHQLAMIVSSLEQKLTILTEVNKSLEAERDMYRSMCTADC